MKPRNSANQMPSIDRGEFADEDQWGGIDANPSIKQRSEFLRACNDVKIFSA